MQGLSFSLPWVFRPDGTMVHVLNLGWINRRIKHIYRIEVFASEHFTRLSCYLDTGEVYECKFEDPRVLREWLKRKRSLDAPIIWSGITCRKEDL